MKGYHGRILVIDLSRETFQTDTLDNTVYETFIGGKGLGSYLLNEINPPGVDALAPENIVIFCCGPISGSPIWGGCRYGVFTKSPQTGFYSESYSGGKVPEAIDATGHDAIIVKGSCDQPMVLEINPETVQFHHAENLWGKETYETERAVLERYGQADETAKKIGAVVIGPAAENGVCFGVIKNDQWRSAGRTGVGTVLGAKKVKAIVFKGNRKRPLFDSDKVRALAKQISTDGKENPGVHAYKSMGTSQLVKVVNNAGAFPTRYWTEGQYQQWEQISADAFHQQCEVKPHACLRCFMACGRMTTVKQGRHAGMQLEGPEYETIYAFGGLCMIDSIEEIAYLNDICDRLGMDTITAGNLCAFTIEAYKRDKVDYKIDYGDVDAIADLLSMISYRKGIGDVLAEGIRHAAREWDLEDIAVHVKGMEPAGYDPRVLKGMGLAYATSDRGACHLRATFYKPELVGMITPEQIEGKAAMFIDFEDRLTIFDTLVLCRFYRDLYLWDRLGEIIHALTGLPGDEADLRKKAVAVSNLVRRFNIREGLTIEDDRLPKGLFKALKNSGHRITPEEMDIMLKDYYMLRGWDQNGVPS